MQCGVAKVLKDAGIWSSGCKDGANAGALSRPIHAGPGVAPDFYGVLFSVRPETNHTLPLAASRPHAAMRRPRIYAG